MPLDYRTWEPDQYDSIPIQRSVQPPCSQTTLYLNHAGGNVLYHKSRQKSGKVSSRVLCYLACTILL